MLNRSPLFSRPRFKLAGAYAVVMGILLSILGIALHEAIANSADEIIERELKTLGRVFEDALTPLLQQPGQLSPAVTQSFPALCLTQAPCPSSPQVDAPNQPGEALGATPALISLQAEGYRIRLLNLAGQPIATLGQADPSFDAMSPEVVWQFTQASWGDRYRVYSLPLTTRATATPQPWGYLQIGCSYQSLEKYMQLLHLLLLVGLPLGIGSVALTAWWLSGMAMRPIAKSYERIQQFTADVAHELRTPLSAMRATTEAELSQRQLALTDSDHLAEAPLADDDASVLPKLHYQILRLSKLVQDLLLLSRLEDDSQPPTLQPVSLNEFLEDLEEEFAPLILESQIHFKLSLPPDRLAIQGDLDALYRLFINLIANGIQHTPPAGTVAVAMVAADRMVKITVQDSGPGIEPAKQQQIFDRFYRIAGERDRQTGGAGLGLAIAQAIAQRHGGNIQLKSELGQGSCFTVRLPLG
jgi:signal transduction histidine kinase